MDKEIEKILESIEINEKQTVLFDLRQQALTATASDAKGVIEQARNMRKGHFVGQDLFENQPYYYLFEGYAHEVLRNREEAINCANRAASLFRMRNQQWNEALVHWFLSILYQRHSRKDDSCKELQIATAILEGLAKGFQRDGRVADCQSCQTVLRQLYRYISLSKSDLELISPATQDHKGYLLPDWMPVYEQIQRDEKEIITWVEPNGSSGAEIQLIIIGERWYSIKSVRPNDEKILLDSTREYGWAKVRGSDMNAAQPIPIADGDYVLFIKQPEVKEDDLVVASRWKDPKQKEYSYMVRKLGKKIHGDNTLYSESSEVSDRYKPIPVGEDTQILGYVVAVAKPIRSRSIETTLVVEQSEDLLPAQKLTPDFLAKVLTPYLNAIADMQKVVCEISNQSPKEIEIKIIQQFSPFSIGLDGVLQGTIDLIRMASKWRTEHERKMAELIEKQAQVDIELKEEEVEKRKLENKRLCLEIDKLRQELSPSLEAFVMPLLPPELSQDDQHAQLARLIPHLLVVASSRLEIKNIESRHSPSPQLEEQVSDRQNFSSEKPAAQTEEELYRTLLAMVGHDQQVVERLVKHEHGFAPDASRTELLNNAIKKLLRDRHFP